MTVIPWQIVVPTCFTDFWNVWIKIGLFIYAVHGVRLEMGIYFLTLCCQHRISAAVVGKITLSVKLSITLAVVYVLVQYKQIQIELLRCTRQFLHGMLNGCSHLIADINYIQSNTCVFICSCNIDAHLAMCAPARLSFKKIVHRGIWVTVQKRSESSIDRAYHLCLSNPPSSWIWASLSTTLCLWLLSNARSG